MPTYEVTIPGSGTYQVDSPTELTDAQAHQAALGQSSGQAPGQPPPSPAAPPQSGVNDPFGLLPNVTPQGAQIMANFKANTFGSALPAQAYAFGGKMTDLGSRLGLPPSAAAGLGYLSNMGVQLLPNLMGARMDSTPVFANRIASNEAAANAAKVQNAVRDQALLAGRQEGLVVPPSTINPTLGNSAVESLGGKIATQQQASVINQKGVDTLVRRGLGLAPDAPVTEQTLTTMRSNAGQPYAAIKSLPGKFQGDAQFANDISGIGADFSQAAKDFPASTKNAAIDSLNSDLQIGSWSPRGVIEKIKLLRSDAAANFKAFNDPEKLALARAQRQAADALDGVVTRNLAANGQQDLAASYQAARTTIAKLHDAEAAFTPGGHFDARVLAKIGERSPLTGEFKTVADFAGNFPKAVQTGEKVGSPMVHAARPVIGSAIGAGIGGVPGAAMGAAAGIGVPWLARLGMLSGAGQNLLATPSYSAGTLAALNSSGLLPSLDTAQLLGRGVLFQGAQ